MKANGLSGFEPIIPIPKITANMPTTSKTQPISFEIMRNPPISHGGTILAYLLMVSYIA